ncbi:MAG: hypothetical protein M2R45_01601 [Verrucomicrobia subdivision 3 bacterium]|nr:hypothetical protein [Limisphaerales bacterium]MCS1412753.1 hypothetical protein [Limisphaerales bacterium]
MKKLWGSLGAIFFLLAAVPQQIAADESVTLNGVGLCAKCALGQTDTCQNAIKVKVDGKEVVYLLTANDVSKAFHKNLCSGSTSISAVGLFKEIGGKKVFTANKLSLRKEEVVKGEGLCLKCALGLTPSCQNGIRIDEDGKQVLYVIAHDDVGKSFHKHVCQNTVEVVATGKIGDVAGLSGVKKLTAAKIELVKVAAKEQSAEEASVKKVAKAKAAPDKQLTIKGLGMCAKCELGETAQCQNAVKLTKDGKEVIYLFAANDVSEAFHKNVCSSTANIVATGALSGEGGRPVFTATKLAVQETKTLEGTGLCLKCEMGKSRTCQNVIKVSVDGEDIIYILDQNSVSKKFHRYVCQDSVAVVAEGTVSKIKNQLEFTASKIDLK